MKTQPLVSVITVVFNGEAHLEKTIKSVLNQTYENIEYIIIDGASTDGTLDIIKKYEDKITYWISQRDEGIYDAMNKGIDKVSGEWINFMNAGDTFYNNDILKNIFHESNFKNIAVIYGKHNVIYPNRTKIKKPKKIIEMWKGSQFCHQSSFISSLIQKKNKFNIRNRIGADFELFYTLYKQKLIFKYINIIIVNYSAGGLSDVKRIDSIVGWWNVVHKNTKVNFYYLYTITKEIIKSWIKQVVK